MRILSIEDIWENVADKLPVVEEWMKKYNFPKQAVAYMGNDIPDLRCMRNVGLPTCPCDAAGEVKQEAMYISPFTGGYGAGRDISNRL